MVIPLCSNIILIHGIIVVTYDNNSKLKLYCDIISCELKLYPNITIIPNFYYIFKIINLMN